MHRNQSLSKSRILFIVLPYLVKHADAKNPKIRSFAAFPYGLLSMATYLKKYANRKVDIKIIDCNLYSFEEAIQAITDVLADFKPQAIGLSMMFDQSYKALKDILSKIKENSGDALVLLGGSAASFSYKEILSEQEDIDAICYSEGEVPLLKLINSENIRESLETDFSWVTRKAMETHRAVNKSFVPDLNDVIDIDYSLVDIKNYAMKEAFSPYASDQDAEKKQFFLVTSRGCPYKCVFCSTSSALYGNKIRYADVDAIISHVRHLVSDHGMNVLTIYDDQLLSNKARAKEIFRQLAPFKIRIECPNGLSVAFIDDEMAALMRKAGMDTIALAIESGSKYMLEKVIHKPLKLEMVKPVVQILRKYGFFIEGFFVIGIPGEKEEHRKETMNFIKDIQLDWAGFSLATPARGSELYEICIKNGYIDKNLKIDGIQDKKYIIRTPDLNPEDITRKTYLMNLDVNFVHNFRMKIGDYKVAANCFKDVISRYANHAFAYYYLMKAEEAMGEDAQRIRRHGEIFQAIIEKDNTWVEYFEHFAIPMRRL